MKDVRGMRFGRRMLPVLHLTDEALRDPILHRPPHVALNIALLNLKGLVEFFLDCPGRFVGQGTLPDNRRTPIQLVIYARSQVEYDDLSIDFLKHDLLIELVGQFLCVL